MVWSSSTRPTWPSTRRSRPAATVGLPSSRGCDAGTAAPERGAVGATGDRLVVGEDPWAEVGRIGSELTVAIVDGQLVVAYQPIVDAAGEVRKVEALVRWQHPTRGLLLPGDFIPVAERTRLMGSLSAEVLRQACDQVATWRRSLGMHELELAVNISGRELADPNLSGRVQAALRTSGLPAKALWVEITETAVAVEPLGRAEASSRWRRWASASPSTTSAPASPRWPSSTSSGRGAEDRPDVRQRDGRRGRWGHRHRADGPLARSRARHERHRRGGGDGGAAVRAGRHGVRAVPGLPVRPAVVRPPSSRVAARASGGAGHASFSSGRAPSCRGSPRGTRVGRCTVATAPAAGSAASSSTRSLRSVARS